MKNRIFVLLALASMSVMANGPVMFNGFWHYPTGKASFTSVDQDTLRVDNLNSSNDGVHIDLDQSMFSMLNMDAISRPANGDGLSFYTYGDLDGEADSLLATTQMSYSNGSWTLTSQSEMNNGSYTVQVYNDGKLVAQFSRSHPISVRSSNQAVGVGIYARQVGGGGGPCPPGSAPYYQCIVGPGPGSYHGGPCAAYASFTPNTNLSICCANNNGTIISTCSGPVAMAADFDKVASLVVDDVTVVGNSVHVMLDGYDQRVSTISANVVNTSGIGSLYLKAK